MESSQGLGRAVVCFHESVVRWHPQASRCIFAKSIGGLSVLALAMWSAAAFGAPQDSAVRPASSVAANRTIKAGTSNTGIEGLTTAFNYTNFSDVSLLTFNGNAKQAGTHLLLMPPTTNQIGSIWYHNQVNVAQGFTTDFTFRLIPSSGSPTTGDGIAFVIQNSELSALGEFGGFLGYTGIPNSLAVEFDTFFNASLSDPNNNHVGVQSCGIAAIPAIWDSGPTCLSPWPMGTAIRFRLATSRAPEECL